MKRASANKAFICKQKPKPNVFFPKELCCVHDWRWRDKKTEASLKQPIFNSNNSKIKSIYDFPKVRQTFKKVECLGEKRKNLKGAS